MSRLAFFVVLVLFVVTDASAAPRPNIVFILADDLGFSDLGCYGGEIATPNLDRLATGGVRFTQFYNTARCWPSRASLLTGYYAQQVNRDPGNQRPKWAPLLPELLTSAGYRAYHTGKWHVDGPVLAGGFTRSYQIIDQDRFFTPRNHQLDDRALAPPKPGDGYYATIAVADRAIEWLDEHQAGHKDEPFFLYVAFTSPHFPLHALAEDIDRYRDRYLAGWDVIRRERFQRITKLGLVSGRLSDAEPRVVPGWNFKEAELQKQIGPDEVAYAVPWTDLTPEQQRFQATKMAIHAAMIDRMDREIGRILERLRQMGTSDNTLVLFASDNGASAEQIIRGDRHSRDAAPGSAESYLGLGPGWSTVANAPFRRHKSWNHEGGIATPLVAHWPAGIRAAGELRHAPGHLVDIAPTMLELAGVAPPISWNGEPRPILPGRSLVPIFARDTTEPHAPLFFKHMANRGLRVGNWKIVAAGEDAPWELYDLAADRTETSNLAASQPDKVSELAGVWTALDAEYTKQGATGARLDTRAKRNQKTNSGRATTRSEQPGR
jgi:arylsulfatase